MKEEKRYVIEITRDGEVSYIDYFDHESDSHYGTCHNVENAYLYRLETEAMRHAREMKRRLDVLQNVDVIVKQVSVSVKLV